VLYELSTPFLNIHWFMDKLGMTGARAQLVNGILLLVTFAGCRLVWGVYQSALIYSDVWHAWHATTPFASRCAAFFSKTRLNALVNVPLDCRVLPTWLGVLYVGANTLLTLLNFFWYSKMIAAVTKRFKSPQEADKKEHTKEHKKKQ
jgi:hypothetical protein